MNKIFKVIWNHAAQRFDVVSELTKSNGKSSSTTDNRIEPSKALLALGVAGAALLGTTDAMAALSVAQPKAGASGVVTSGTNANSGDAPLYISTPEGNTYGTAVLIGKGVSNKNNGGGSVIIGDLAKGDNLSVVIGRLALSEGQQDIVIGSGAQQLNTDSKSYSTVIGREAINTASGKVATTIGYKAQTSAAYATAIGGSSRASASGATAIGYNATGSGGSALAMGFNSNASASMTMALGASSSASAMSATAVGAFAKARKDYSLALGSSADANANHSIAIGNTAGVTGEFGVAVGPVAKSIGVRAIAIGRSAYANGADSTAMGQGANTTADHSIAIGFKANVTVATATNSIAMGNASTVSGSNSISIGPDSNVTGNSSTAVGVGNQVYANNAGAFGDPNTIQAGADGSYAFGNDNTISGPNTFVLGNNVTVSTSDSVVLGNDSAQAAAVPTNDATVGPITYSGFAGNAVDEGEYVSVGAAGDERQIKNVAAGQIKKDSTDAINGSQLYAVAAELGKGFNVTSSDGTSNVNILPGENVQFVNGTLTTANVKNLANGGGASVTFDVDKGTFNATQTGALIANTSDTGVATVADVANAVNAGYWKVGNKDNVVNNVNFGDDVRFLNGTNTTVTVAADGKDRTNITIDTDFSKLPTQNTATANITNNGGTISVDVNMGEGSVNGDGVASVNNGDTNKVANISNVVKLVNEAGWNIFQDNDASANKKDLVVAGDNVVFAAGTNTTVSVETDAAKKTTTIKYDVDLSKVPTTPVAVENTTLSVTNGKVNSPAEGNKLVNATTVASAINDSGWQTTLTDGSVETINPGDKVNYVDGQTTKANVVKTNTGDVNVSFEVNKQDVTAGTDGKAALEGTATNADNFVTAGDVMNTINNVFWTATSDTDGGKFATTGHTKSNAQVKAGDAVVFKAGEGLTIKQDGTNFTYAVAAGDVTSDTNVANVTTTLGKAVTDTTSGIVATVGDVADAINNSGWVTTTTAGNPVLVNPGDTVDYVDGKNTKANVVANSDGGVDVTFDVNTGTSSVTTDGKAKADTADGDVATITDVVNTINSVYHSVASTKVADTNGESTYVANDESNINAGDTVNYNAGKNIKISGSGDTIEIATTDNVTFTNTVVNSTLSLGNVSDAAAPVVNMTSQAAVPATNNDLVNNKAPTTALNITAKDGNPTQITGVGSVLNTTNVETNPDADTATNVVNSPLVDLGKDGAPLADNILNSAATVRDLTNMGWVVSTETGEYKDTVKNANEVKFVAGSDRVSVTGETVNDVRKITIDLAKVNVGEVKDPTTPPTDKDGDINFADTATTDVKVNPNTGVVTVDVKTTELTPTDKGNITEPADATEGAKLVNATTVANAINKSGFTLKSSAAEGTKVSGNDEVINPGDVVDMAAGKNMTVKQEASGKITYATAEDVDFNTVTLSNGTEPSVKLVNEAAVPATNNDVANAPTAALNITSTDGKPTQIAGVGSVLNTTLVPTNVNTGGNPTLGDSTLVNLGSDTTPLADNILNSAATVRDLTNMGWIVSTETGAYTDTVKNANEVKFISGSDRVSVTGETNATTGVREITIDLAKVNVGEVTDPTTPPKDKDGDINFADTATTDVTVNPNTGVVTVDVKTTKLTPTDKGNITEPADATEGAKLVNATTVANAINKSGWNAKSGGNKADGDMAEATLINPSEEVTFSAGKNLTVKRVNNEFTFATAADVDFNSVTVGNDGDKITIGNVGGKNVVGNLDTTITEPTTSNNPADKPTGDALNNAATLGDVLNAGWNLQENGNAKDVVTPYDTVNFVNGAGSSVKVESNGTVSKVVYNVNVDGKTTEYTYIDDKGNKLTAETQPDGTVVYKDEKGAVYAGPVTSRVSAILPTTTVDGKEVGGDITFGDTTTANVTTNDAGDIVVNVNTGDSNATKDGKATALTDKQGNPVNKVVAADGSVTYTDEDGKPVAADDVVDSTEKVATVGDIVDTINKTGWKATSGKVGTGIVSGTNEELISPSDVVTFQAGDNMVLTQVGKVFTYSVNPDPVFNTTTAKAGMTIGEGDTAVNMTPTTANVVNGGDVNGKVTPAVDMNGATFTNISSNLPNTTSVGNNPTTTGPITAQEAADLAKTSGSNAATLNDVLNAGWTLQENDNAKDFVKPFDTVNFKNGKGTTANITSDGSVSNVSYSVNVDNTTTEITYVSTDAKGNNTKVYLQADGSYNTARDGSGTKVDAKTITGNQVSAILPTFNGNSTAGNVNFENSTTADINYNSTTGNVTVDVKTGTSSVSDGKAKDADGNTIAAGKAVADTTNGTVATIADVVDTINSVYHSVASTKVAETNGESDYKVTEESKIGAGDVVNYNAGQNIKISGEGNNINISTTENVTFTNANVTNNLTVDGNTTVNNFTVKPNSTIDMGNNIIGNVEAGVKGTDAVNVSQLNATKDAFNWKVTGNNNASNATAVGNQTVSFNNGAGTTAVVDGTNVTYNVNVDGKTTQITYTDADGNTVTKNADGTYTKANGDVVEAANVTSQVSVAFGNVAANPTTGTAEGDISPRVASTGDVANAINGSGWKTTDKDGNTLLVNPGDTVNYVNGNGTTANVTKTTGADGKDVVSVTFDVKTAAETTTNANGSIAAPTDGANFVNATTLVNTVNNASWNVNSTAVEGSTGKVLGDTTASKVKAGDTVNVNAGNNIEITRNGNNVAVATSMTPTFTTVQVGGSTGPVIGADENGDVKVAKADGSAAKITNVAAGTANTDAVNVSQLKQVAGDIHNKINRNNKDLRAGIAGANAAAGLPQVYIPGKSMVAASAGTFKGQSAVAVGYSRASDNGKLILKLQGNANTRGDVGGSVGVGYQW
ncbi:YadA-like family protein [Actinobacillus minor]|uniref:YadA-like family protein n=1 Tax=Actinobacillus minor TaxID=51047 RepID=UPI0023F506A8|nr:YadA-like family protein [Actinobacillus minor]MDD6910244.1 YadA-like family protein [Actinobacillus minor]